MKTNWKAKLKTVLETKQKSELPSKTVLTKADNTFPLKKDSSVFVSDNLLTFPGISESGNKTAKQKLLPESRNDVVSSVSVSGHLTDSGENFQPLAQTKNEKIHETLNRFIYSGIVFDVDVNDFSIIRPLA